MNRLRYFAVVLLLATGCAQAADKKHSAAAAQSVKLQQGINRIVALPAELAQLLFGYSITTASADDTQWKTPVVTRSLAGDVLSAPAAAREKLKVMLAENSLRVWLAEDVNLHCDLEQEQVFARSDQFVLKFGLQYRFR
jgi:hypothetical protein